MWEMLPVPLVGPEVNFDVLHNFVVWIIGTCRESDGHIVVFWCHVKMVVPLVKKLQMLNELVSPAELNKISSSAGWRAFMRPRS
jgi:hypothetical protein